MQRSDQIRKMAIAVSKCITCIIKNDSSTMSGRSDQDCVDRDTTVTKSLNEVDVRRKRSHLIHQMKIISSATGATTHGKTAFPGGRT